MNRKVSSVSGISIAIALLISLVFPYVTIVSAADPATWYMTVKGVLTSDYYSLYPYTAASIDFGLSKFGEVVNYPVTAGVGLGLQYPGFDKAGTYNQKLTTARDPFANEYIDPKLWLNGWLIEIRYTHRTERDRYIIAMAMFADMSAYGGDWLVGHPLPISSAPHGGRKINTYAETEDLTILYNGPRLFVVQSLTHIYDWLDDGDGQVEHPDETWGVVDVKLTFVFEKVKKYVIIFKDIKQVISGKELESPLDIQFSNREEWDLGPATNYASYAHFFHQKFSTCYGPQWHLAPGIMREIVQSGWGLLSVPTTITAADGSIWIGPIADGSVRVYVDGAFKEEGTDYEIDYEKGKINWKIPVSGSNWVVVVYKLWKKDTYKKGIQHLYDVAQVISSDKKFVGFKAYWPVLSDYTVDGWAKSFEPLILVSEPDMIPIGSEPDIPMTIGEWDFMLGKGYPQQFRGVEVLGLTDWHDAVDNDKVGDWKLDREVAYQLNEVFNPWDLEDAVHKETKSWVEFLTARSDGTVGLNKRPFKYVPDDQWDQYCVFSERVIDLATGKLLNRWKGEYRVYVDYDSGYATIYGLTPGRKYKILYHTLPSVDEWHWSWLTKSQTFINVTIEPLDIDVPSLSDWWNDKLGVTHDLTLYTQKLSVTIPDIQLGQNWTDTYTIYYLPLISEEKFKVFAGETHYTNIPDILGPITEYTDNKRALIELDLDSFSKSVSDAHDKSVIWPLPRETVHVDWLSCSLYFYINVTLESYSQGGNKAIVEVWIGIPSVYREHLGGRYEWTVVGRDAHTIDSAGAALVTAAFKNKQIEIGLSGADMYDPLIAAQMPWVMHKFGIGDTKADYEDIMGRAALRDDWCTNWPVADSNTIAVGGPLANMLAYYVNDFSSAFFGLREYSAAAWANNIIALSCWSFDTYSSSEEVGYAVISTYKDINGTVIFQIWGHWGRDTYYATQWFQEDGIYELQRFPECATGLVLEIQYNKTPEGYKPTSFKVVEVLGTISETGFLDRVDGEWKGEIHPDP